MSKQQEHFQCYYSSMISSTRKYGRHMADVFFCESDEMMKKDILSSSDVMYNKNSVIRISIL